MVRSPLVDRMEREPLGKEMVELIETFAPLRESDEPRNSAEAVVGIPGELRVRFPPEVNVRFAPPAPVSKGVLSVAAFCTATPPIPSPMIRWVALNVTRLN